MPNIRVLALHEPTGSTFARITTADGRYSFDNVRVGGPYALHISGDGLVSVEHKGLKLRTETVYEHDFTLQPAT
ncbi:MAG: carboxypeptidase regulatory-like domain-containing protein [Pseudomonadales bacterium]|nr:carboxypeptidase regulatory-like domain-containing protein [Pseudomonadales bacterium]